MKRLLLLLYMLILIPAGAMGQEIEKRGLGPGRLVRWMRYTVQGEEFSVTLPTSPAMTTRKTFHTRLQKHRLELELKASSDAVLYSVDVFENSKPRQSLEDFIAEQNANSGYDLTTESSLTVNGFAGKQYSSLNRTSPATARFFATEQRLYRFAVSGSSAEHPGVRQFFSSIRLGKKEDIEVADEPIISLESDPDKRIFTGREVDTKARLTSKPEPRYTEEARKESIEGIVVLKAVFSANGRVENIRIVSGLPHGLTERAIDAARKIKFIPATKDGKPVSMWMQLEYNFDPYR
jgi:TonB family protein